MTLTEAREALAKTLVAGIGSYYCGHCGRGYSLPAFPQHNDGCTAEAARVVLAALEQAEHERELYRASARAGYAKFKEAAMARAEREE